MKELVVSLFVLLSTVLMSITVVGIFRFPDVLLRLQATTKAGTLGLGLILLAAAIDFASLGGALRALVALGFFMFTSPVAAHLIARGAYLSHAEIWRGTLVDELSGRYDHQRARLESHEVARGHSFVE